MSNSWTYLTNNGEIYLIVHIGKNEFALNTDSIESIHSFASINFKEGMNRCLPESEIDWDKSVPVFNLKESSNNECETSFVKHSSRVIFLSDNQTGRTAALIVNAISKVVNVSTEKENLIVSDEINHIQIDNKEVKIFNIRNVFIT